MSWLNYFGFSLWMCPFLAEESNGVGHPEDPKLEEMEMIDEKEEGWW